MLNNFYLFRLDVTHLVQKTLLQYYCYQCNLDHNFCISSLTWHSPYSILNAKFGKTIKVSSVHIQCITCLPTTINSNPNRKHKYFEKLVISAQALETMNKLKEPIDYVRLTLDKLLGIRADVVRLDDNWQEWDFVI